MAISDHIRERIQEIEIRAHQQVIVAEAEASPSHLGCDAISKDTKALDSIASKGKIVDFDVVKELLLNSGEAWGRAPAGARSALPILQMSNHV
jgi:hypothetical protein